jgi:hypothetical protein
LPKSPPDGTPRRPDTVLELHEGDCGGLLAYDDDGAEGLFSAVAFTPSQSGTYSARATEFWGSVGAYTFSVRVNTAPLVAFMGEPDYESDVFRPDIGLAEGTWFVFKAIYYDADGDEPDTVGVRLRTDGSEPPVSPITMQRVAGDPLIGVRYRARRRLAAGEYECRIEASDGFAVAGGQAATWQPGPIVRESSGGALITSLSVLPNAPRSAEVRFSAATAGEASVGVLNIAGREVRQVAAAMAVEPGLNTVVWDGTAIGGASAPRGMYLIEVCIEARDGTRDRRVGAFRW